FADSPLYRELAAAGRTLREMDFTMACGPALLHGQIDLLYAGADGRWHIVDYKSDRLDDAAAAAEHARRYELQVLTYAMAAASYFGGPPADARLYFLRPGLSVAIPVNAADLERGRSRLEELARKLIDRRRTGDFEPRAGESCRTCPYAGLCASLAGGGGGRAKS
ncbi:MAG: PD-(D/E)XK nuclease family protein, partial [Planctomycetes bacterium]|nr:PD-(D/E)XK nuclease family protein [Planctomycetota bacterium]